MQIDRTKEAADFDARVAEMAKRLSAHGVLLEKKEYLPEVFGCWHLVGGTENKKFDFSYDGKDSILMYYDTAIAPKDYRDVQQRRFRIQEGEDPLAFAEDVLAREFHTDEERAQQAAKANVGGCAPHGSSLNVGQREPRLMNNAVAVYRAKELKAVQRAQWLYCTAAILGLLVLIAALVDLIRKEPHALREVSLALLILVVGVTKYVELKKKIGEARALGEK